ncbi:hypothetical protein M0802_004233 [Mischocyttarus mexicanus]|nr:hypothetical protein M0802_004233 [Mischocyttarus mexicanus]
MWKIKTKLSNNTGSSSFGAWARLWYLLQLTLLLYGALGEKENVVGIKELVSIPMVVVLLWETYVTTDIVTSSSSSCSSR